MNVMEAIEPPMIDIAETVSIPPNLTDWVSKAQLRQWVLEPLAELDWSSPELAVMLKRFPSFEPRAVLASLSLAYACGIFGADDIVGCCSRDPEFRPIRPALPPRIQEFSSFRKLNRVLLKAVLAHVIAKALKTQFVEGEDIVQFPPGIRRLILENATERLDIARHMDRTSAA